MNLIRHAVFAIGLCGLCGLGQPRLAAAGSDDLNFEIRLIWGTDQQKSSDKNLYELPKGITKKIGNVFKWKRYYGVRHKGRDRHLKTVPKGKTIKVAVSDHCRLDIKNRDGTWVEIKLFGEGKPLLTKKQKVVPDELLVFCGDCKNDETAWFVVMKSLKTLPKEKASEPKKKQSPGAKN